MGEDMEWLRIFVLIFLSFSFVIVGHGQELEKGPDAELETGVIWQWTRLRGGSGEDHGRGAAMDGNGNLYVTGYTESSFDGQKNTGKKDAFIMKYDASGVWQWTRLRGASGDELVYGMAVDAAGNIYMTGSTESSSFDGQTNKGGDDAFVMKYDSTGKWQWTRLRGGSRDDHGTGIAVDGAGNVYVAGITNSSSFDGQTNKGGNDAFAMKYDSAGKWQWTRLRGGSSDDYGTGIAVDGIGNLIITGTTDSSSIDGQMHSSGRSAFLVNYNLAGEWQWTKLQVGREQNIVESMVIDGFGNVFMTGYTESSSLDGKSYGGGSGAFVMMYDSLGTWLWTSRRSASGNDWGKDLSLDGAGNVYIVGHAKSSFKAQTDGGLDDAYDAFVMKYDSSGIRQWECLRGGSKDDWGTGIAVDRIGTVYVTGDTESSSLDGQRNNGVSDVFIMKYNGAASNGK